MDGETREEIKTLLGKALINLQWKEDESAIGHIKDAYNKIKQDKRYI